jgi:hypothetical protein
MVMTILKRRRGVERRRGGAFFSALLGVVSLLAGHCKILAK